MKIEEYYCDVCGGKGGVKLKEKIQVIFTTEQTEGRSVDPHLSIEEIDLCHVCIKKILNGNYLYGSGAQGYNKYWFGGIK